MDECRKIAIQITRKYLYELERKNTYRWNSAEFMQVSFSRIAAIKILERLKSKQSQSVLTIIENFRDEMDRYSYMNEFNSRMYSIQYDASTYILDEIIANRERRNSKWTTQN